MERSKLSHTTFDYECGQAVANVNIYTGRLLVTTNDLTVGAGNYTIDIRHVFNSQFKSIKINSSNDVIGFDNGWKLNIQEYVFPYNESFNLEGFETGDYVYIDSSFNVHRFIKYGIDSENRYYDSAGTNLRLTYDSYGVKEITDNNGNKLKFNYFGQLTNIVSGINSEIEKVIEYDPDTYLISKIYDKRSQSNQITFHYESGKLSHILNELNDIYIRYSYNSSGMLSKITKERYNAKKDILYLEYNDGSDVNLIVDMQTSKALKITHLYSSGSKRVMNISKKWSKGSGYKTTKDYLLASGEDNYTGDNLYVGEKEESYTYKYDTDDALYEEYNVSINPQDESYIMTRCDGVKKVYFVNYEGDTISVLEELEHENYCNASYRSLDKISGLSIHGVEAYKYESDDPEYAEYDESTRDYNVDINGMMNDIIENQVVNISEGKIQEIKSSFGESSEAYKYTDKFNLSFYANFPIESNLFYSAKVNITYEDSNNEEVELTIGKSYIGEVPIDSWAFVNIPINFSDHKNTFTKLKIVFEGREANGEELSTIQIVNVADIRLVPHNFSECYVYGDDLNDSTNKIKTINLNNVFALNYLDEQSIERRINIDTDNYITENDLYEISKSIYLNRNENSSYFDFIFNNGRKVIRTSRVLLLKNRVKIELSVDNDGICNLYNESFSKLGEEIKDDVTTDVTSKTTVNYRFHKDDTNLIYYEEKTTQEITDSSGTHSSETYNWVNRNGLQRAKKDAYKVITEEFYDVYGNKTSTQIFNEKNQFGERFITEYVYYKSEELRKNPDEVIENGIKTEYIYDDKSYVLKEVIKGNQKIKYEYDVFLDRLINVSFIDMLTDKTITTYKLYYDANNNIKNITDNKGIDHSFNVGIGYDYTYNKFYDNTNVYYNNKLIQSNVTYDDMSFMCDNGKRGSKVIQYVLDDVTEEVNNESVLIYDKYERVAKHLENDKEIVYQYGDGLLYQNLNKITDPYSNQDYEYLYDESNNNYGYNVINNADSNESVKYYDIKVDKSLPNRTEYSFLTKKVLDESANEEIETNNQKVSALLYENSKVAHQDKLATTLIVNRIYDQLGSNPSLAGPRLFRTSEYNKSFLGSELEYEYLYHYDYLGRVNKIINILSSESPTTYDDAFESILTKEITYKENTNLVNRIEYKFEQYDYNYDVNQSFTLVNEAVLLYNNYTYDNLGNVISVSKGGSYYDDEFEQGAGNLASLNSSNVNYEYDSFNRLTKENNSHFGNFKYNYDDSNNLSTVEKYNNNTNEYEVVKSFNYSNGRLSSSTIDDFTCNYYYDNYGNLKHTKSLNLYYSNRNQLSKVYNSYTDETIYYDYNHEGVRFKKTYENSESQITKTKRYYLEGKRIQKEIWKDSNNKVICDISYFYNANGICGIRYKDKNYTLIKDELGNVIQIMYHGKLIAEYIYDAWGNCEIVEYSKIAVDKEIANINPFRYKGYYCDVETQLYWVSSRYYSPEFGRFLQVSDVSELNPHSINGLNLYAYANNNPISFSYNNSSAVGSTNVAGGLVSSIGAGNSFTGNVNSSSPSKGGLNLGWLANGLDTGSTIHGLYTSISGLVNHTAYFAKNLIPFADDMTMLGASMKDGVLAFNQFSWGLGKSDIFGVALGVGLDIYDSIQRGVSPGGVVLGATLTAAKGVGLIYLNKGILYGATALGSAICPGVGTVVGFVVGGVVCIVVDIFANNWLDDLIDKIAK